MRTGGSVISEACGLASSKARGRGGGSGTGAAACVAFAASLEPKSEGMDGVKLNRRETMEASPAA